MPVPVAAPSVEPLTTLLGLGFSGELVSVRIARFSGSTRTTRRELNRQALRLLRCRRDVSSFTGSPEDAEDLGGLGRPCCRTSAGPGVEGRDLAGPEHQVLVAEDEAHVARQDVDPFVAVVCAWLRGGLAGRDDDLPGLDAIGVPGQRDHGPALDAARLEPEPRVALLGCGRRGRPAAPGRRARARAAAPGWAAAPRSQAATACSSRSRSSPRHRSGSSVVGCGVA